MSGSPSSSTSSSSPPPVSSISRSSTENLHCPNMNNSQTQDVVQSIVKGRKSWKTLRGGEIVWPPELEAALIEGLEKYEPNDSRETRLLGRFPMRNRFISDHIFQKTGKIRTPKQVGSRLQQLRDTCGGKKLLKLLSPIRRQYRSSQPLSPELYHGSLVNSLRYNDDSCSDASPPNSPTTPVDTHTNLQTLLYHSADSQADAIPQTIVYIDLLLDESLDASSNVCSSVDERGWTDRGFKVIRSSQHPRRMAEIDPTITLVSRSTAPARSFFSVYANDAVIFSEDTTLVPFGCAPGDSEAILYSTTLVPGFWHKLSQSSDPSKYTIVQRVVQDSSSDSPASVIFSAMYKFNYPSSFSTSSPIYPRDARIVPAQVDDFALDCLLPLDPESFNVDYEKTSVYYDMASYMKSDWNPCSPTSLSAHTSSDGSLPNDLDDDLMSPCSATFPNNIPYVRRSIKFPVTLSLTIYTGSLNYRTHLYFDTLLVALLSLIRVSHYLIA
ncbi:hypothetical protein BDQ12DRAFT_595088 [Crucibulum laeve]|uniref:TEA domain-containing protein n=1 Tax=Crucibulum laeve TaxID=68775 RepID=A0A5C3MUR8_9AGAR|nr:hypothetical protein BDQ12DRAFT_595088 [Crucibulum laeve]